MGVMTIDYVVPMVFHDDPLWQADFLKVGARYNESRLTEFVRWRSWGTERLLIQCVKKFMPFVRTIYILLARESQKQAWMDKEGVRIVYHKDFIPKEFLPTFNSATIEMFLHRIPGISDMFIYGNDDIFPLSLVNVEDFFRGDLPCLHYEEEPMPQYPNIFLLSCRNGLNFVGSEFGKKYTNTWLKGSHGLTPMIKSTYEHLWTRGSNAIRCSISPMREEKNFYQWIIPWWHYLSGNYVDSTLKTKYVSVRQSVDEVVSAIRSNESSIVCINDHECELDYMKYGLAIKDAIGQLLISNKKS